ncbi:hypothetical protein I4F81_001918 [Pyropia yezoensis]|uniref:Uncharacterized protein n=1 Tax=Pyropia yezoensis TaxID=2788 RepID=A0ACC3BMX6_PYRYE|nr:hypothetical protein I4F81_001918 [Neopyropia yezoensis]
MAAGAVASTPPPLPPLPRLSVAIDRGGTFTDVFAQLERPPATDAPPDTPPPVETVALKLLSVDPAAYADAPLEAIRRLLGRLTGTPLAVGAPLPTAHLRSVRMATTVATNALLERAGTPTVLVLTAGLGGALAIGSQARPALFDLSAARPPPLYAATVEATERVVLTGPDRRTPTVEVPLDEAALRADLRRLHRDYGYVSVAVALLHSYAYGDHEAAAARIATEEGYTHVTTSAAAMPTVGLVARATTAVVDAYLTPSIQAYVAGFRSGFTDPSLAGVDVQFMQSDGGLSVIGVDMGGTSTDVSRYAGGLELVFEATVAGARLAAPQLDILTVAAGGGSALSLRAGLLAVGPESVGAHPGPAAYRKGGAAAVTDANVVLGRVLPSHFPAIFGPAADQPLDVAASRAAPALPRVLTLEETALGFIAVANEAMCRPIRSLTEAKGHDVRQHELAVFGGAGGQHAVALARSLGVTTVRLHRYAGLLSAYGLALADSVVEVRAPLGGHLGDDGRADAAAIDALAALEAAARAELGRRRVAPEAVSVARYLHLRYEGTDFGLMTTRCYFDGPGWVDDTAVVTAASLVPGARIRGPAIVVDPTAGATVVIEPGCVATVEADGDLVVSVPRKVAGGAKGHLGGSPTTVADGGDSPPAADGGGATPLVAAAVAVAAGGGPADPPPDPVRLSIFGHRFMSIAEQCGRVLQRTAISVNIKERLDFSVALFDTTGGLVANAPHVPVHLGSMQAAVRYQVDLLGDTWAPGDVLLANHPSAGGTHLPDVTVITPVYRGGVPVFYVASRGHQTDVGGATPGSMPPFSTTLAEEGMAVESMKLVEGGVFHEERLVAALTAAGCRCVRDVLSDIKAQVAANNKGVALVGDLIASEGLSVVLSYMRHIQTAAAAAVRSMLRRVSLDAGLPPVGTLRATDAMDDGSVLAVAVTIDRDAGSGVVDFTGTGLAVAGNTNAPPAIAASAVIYTLRCLVNLDIPLNQGCLAPITLRLPEGGLLSPPAAAAVVGGNVLTSQRVTDVLLRAFGAAAASQGCMNNLTFGSADTSYYETIAGGAGAGRSWDGESGVHTHMTNTRITDAEVLERRYPVVLREWALRTGSGGAGAHTGGCGVVRTLEFRAPLTVSILSERRETSPWGAAGGEDGARGENWVSRRGGALARIGGKATVEVEAGDRLRICTPGGGGWGVPSI